MVPEQSGPARKSVDSISRNNGVLDSQGSASVQNTATTAQGLIFPNRAVGYGNMAVRNSLCLLRHHAPCYIFRDGAVNDLSDAADVANAAAALAAVRGVKNDRAVPHNDCALHL